LLFPYILTLLCYLPKNSFQQKNHPCRWFFCWTFVSISRILSKTLKWIGIIINLGYMFPYTSSDSPSHLIRYGDTILHASKDFAVSPLVLLRGFIHPENQGGHCFLSITASLFAPRAVSFLRMGITHYPATYYYVHVRTFLPALWYCETWRIEIKHTTTYYPVFSIRRPRGRGDYLTLPLIIPLFTFLCKLNFHILSK